MEPANYRTTGFWIRRAGALLVALVTSGSLVWWVTEADRTALVVYLGAVATGLTFIFRPSVIQLWRSVVRAAYGHAILLAGDSVGRGQPLHLELQVAPLRSVQPTTIEWELVGEETAISRVSGNYPDYTYSHVFERLTVPGLPAQPFQRGVPVSLRGEILVPATAPPTFSARNHAIQWKVVCRLRATGWPDLVLDRPLAVAMEQPSAPMEVGGQIRRVISQTPFSGELVLDLPEENGIPVARAGGAFRGELRILTDEAIEPSTASVRLLWLLHGSGTAEERVVRSAFARKSVEKGTRVIVPIDWMLPAAAQPSFSGRYLKSDWMLDVDVTIKPHLLPEWRLRFPLWMRGPSGV